ncbi:MULTISPECIES: McrC family protein [unclassified Methylophaga]|jgi:5-methylcytosine-specific restriction enzyme subunit McrC|uniref:McrC family protein n=1 Tax=unclassified Methylophaga TaxID=2629249 RepID=UPI00259CB1C4|nr:MULTISPECIES: McrC family protein [unclassified Methylophaga]|tara:strand:- start:487 stop:1791 length:1305 start_codon:yes stop_codon:yes gene_type:complete
MPVQVREYARLTKCISHVPSIDLGLISETTFNWITRELRGSEQSAKVWKYETPDTLKLGSFVGYIETPNGESIEVLPKTSQGSSDIEKDRLLLRRMLLSVFALPSREIGPADLMRTDRPIHEWILAQFLGELKKLVKLGFRFDYERVEEESYYLRGQLDVARQQRQPANKAHQFHIRHDVFSPNRVENQLIKTALEYSLKVTKDNENWRLANELNHYLEDIESLTKPLHFIESWTHSKLMQAYTDIKPWCVLVLEKLNPIFQKGNHRGISLLFPMEQLFEKYVVQCLRKSLRSPARLQEQAKSKYLVSHQPSGRAEPTRWFQLKPDILLWGSETSHVLDTKWKLINESLNTSENKYGVSQADMYQMLAYGYRYQLGQGHMMLIYPKHSGFTLPVGQFNYSDDLKLWVVPFCLESGLLIQGEWSEYFPPLQFEGG